MSPIEAYGARFGAQRYRWIATFTVMLGTVATTAASTMVNVALPDIMGAFGMGQDQIQWLSTGFLAAMTATMLLTAWALSRFGFRGSFVGAQAVFVAGSLLGMTSAGESEIIFARVIQGMASGLVQPLTMVVLSELFPREQRGRAMGIYGLGIVLAPALGPTLSGYLVDEYSWRDVFLAIVPVSIAASLLAMVFLPPKSAGGARAKKPFDLAGFVLLGVFLVTLLDGLSNGQRYGWDSQPILALFALAACALCGFVAWEMACPTPLLHLRVFASGRFAASCCVAFALGAGIFGSTYVIPLFVQLVQGYSPTQSGLLLMPAGFMLAVVSPTAGHLSDRIPPWMLMTAGLFIFALSCLLCTGADTDTAFLTFAVWIVIGRIGLGLITPSLNAGALRALPQELLAQGSGVVNFVRQLGGAFGVNLLSVLIDQRTATHGQGLAHAVTAGTVASNDAAVRLSLMLAHWGNPFGERLPSHATPAAMAYLESMLVPKAQMFAYRDAFLALALAFLVGIVPAMLMGRPSGKRSASAL